MFGTLINTLVPRTRAATVESLGHPSVGKVEWYGGADGSAGVAVTKDTALTVAAFWCGVRILAETMGTLPCCLYRRTSDDSRERATDDDRYYLMHDQPHPAMSPVTFFETLTAHVVCSGNAYAKLIRTQGGMIDRLEPRIPDTVRVKVVSDDIQPTYFVEAMREEIAAEDMLHILGLGGDGITGWSVLKYGEQTIGSALAATRRAASQHKNGAMPQGAIVHPLRLTKEARESFRREWNEVHEGPDRSGRVAILHGGIDFKPFSMSNTDAQFLETMVHGVRDVARLLRIPLHMLMDLENSAVRANIEQAGIEFLVYTMAPWIVRWQQALNRRLLTRDERRDLYFEFMLDALMRGDISQRYAAYSTARQWGFMSVNEIRQRDNLNAIEGGDVYLQPANMVPAGTVPDTIVGEMQNNLAASLNETVEIAKQLAVQLAAGGATMEEAIGAAQKQITESLASLREDRDLIRADIAALGKSQSPGWQRGSRHERQEHNAVLRAANSQVSRGESFLDWLDSWYAANMDSEYPDIAASHKADLLAATDGDPAGFLDRIKSVIQSWREQK